MKAVIDAIKFALTDDDTYVELLGTPTVEPYKTYYEDPPVTPDFPFVVFVLRPISYNPDMGREFRVGRGELSVNVWGQGISSTPTVETIADRIISLLHQVGNAAGFRCVLSREPQSLRDHEINAWGVNVAFDCAIRRSII